MVTALSSFFATPSVDGPPCATTITNIATDSLESKPVSIRGVRC
jgi:hypothetical protein